MDIFRRFLSIHSERNVFDSLVEAKLLAESAVLHVIEDGTTQHLQQILDVGFSNKGKPEFEHLLAYLRSWKAYYLTYYIEKYQKRVEDNFNFAIDYAQKRLETF